MSITEPLGVGCGMHLVKVDPELAQRLLANTNGNRRVSPVTVSRYAADMASGRWKHPTSEALSIDTTGALQQGQHRLLAVVQSGQTIQFWINYGADPDDFHVLDQGKRRSTADVLGIEGVTNTTYVAAACRMALYLQRYPDIQWTGFSKTMVTPAEVLEFFHGHSDVIIEAVRMSSEARTARIPQSQYAATAALVMLSSESMDLWDEWHQQVVSGVHLAADDPAFALRRWALSSGGRSGGTPAQQGRIACVIKAWNAFVEDRPVRLLRWRRDELPMVLPLPSIQVRQ